MFGFFYKLGKRILEVTGEVSLVEKLLFDLKAEQTPGRFFNKLSTRIADYNKKYPDLSFSIPAGIIQSNVKGDKFFYLKSAIITGLLNSITSLNNNSNE